MVVAVGVVRRLWVAVREVGDHAGEEDAGLELLFVLLVEVLRGHPVVRGRRDEEEGAILREPLVHTLEELIDGLGGEEVHDTRRVDGAERALLKVAVEGHEPLLEVQPLSVVVREVSSLHDVLERLGVHFVRDDGGARLERGDRCLAERCADVENGQRALTGELDKFVRGLHQVASRVPVVGQRSEPAIRSGLRELHVGDLAEIKSRGVNSELCFSALCVEGGLLLGFAAFCRHLVSCVGIHKVNKNLKRKFQIIFELDERISCSVIKRVSR